MLYKQFAGMFKINVKQHFAYRFDFIVWTIVHLVFLVVQYFLWKAIYAYSGQDVIRGFTFIALIQYFILTTFIGSMTYTYTDNTTAMRVKGGGLVKQITKPIKYITLEIIDAISNRIIALIVELAPLLALGFIFFELSTTAVNGILFIISLILAFLLNFMLVFSIGLVSFWTKKYDGIRRIREGAFWFLSGSMIPLAFFPNTVQRIFNLLPFQYVVYIPAKIFLGQFATREAIKMIGVQVIWVVLFLLVANFSWERAYKKYTGVGI